MPTSVLLVDDDRDVCNAYALALGHAGHQVTAVGTAEAALAALDAGGIDVVVSDIHMPGLSGIDLLAAVRERSAELPVIMMTAAPQLDTAVMAVNLGAYKYLLKPVGIKELDRVVRRAGMLHHLARLKHAAISAVDAENVNRLQLDHDLNGAIDGLWMAYQPIVRERGTALLGFEALLRSDASALGRPDLLLDAAGRVNRTRELGRAVRDRVAADATRLPADASVFVNLLPSDLTDPALFDAGAPLSRIAPRVVLELTERATLDSVPNLVARVASLRDLGFRLAVDDLGAGYSGLSSLTQLEPDAVKLDMSLVRDIHASTARQSVVKSMADLCVGMGMLVIAEGIECAEERDALSHLGIDLMQGYHFGKPSRDIVWAPREVS